MQHPHGFAVGPLELLPDCELADDWLPLNEPSEDELPLLLLFDDESDSESSLDDD